MSLRKLFILTCATLVISLPSFAMKGTESGGGGDASEVRVNEIRSDLLEWIKNEGAKGLVLPTGLSYETYVSQMTAILQPKKVIIGFIEKDDENNDELQVNINGTPKTCRGFISREASQSYIICNILRFKNTSESEQYKLIHHEYAGLANIENNEGAASDYVLSIQITDFLMPETILKLAVKNEQGDNFLTKSKEVTLKSLNNIQEIICQSTVSYEEETPQKKIFSQEIFIFRKGLRKMKDTKDIKGDTSFILSEYNKENITLEEDGEQQFYFKKPKQNKIEFEFFMNWKALGELTLLSNNTASGYINQKSYITEFTCSLH